MKSEKNKTLDISVEDGQEYLERCIQVQKRTPIENVLNRTVWGDMKKVCPRLSGTVDLIVADPPYNLNKKYGKSNFKQVDAEKYEAYTREWLSAVVPLLKEGGAMYVCCDWQSSLIVGRVLQDYLTVRNRITWQREKGRGSKNNWKNGMEDIWYAVKGKGPFVFHADDVKLRRKVIAPYTDNGKPKDWTESENGKYRDTYPSNFWDDITIPFWSMPENTAHPTQKPEKLIAKIILASSKKGDIVLDPFLGSGTTSVTAKKLGRKYIGIEKEEQYCIWAEHRLEAANQNTKIQGYQKGIFWERNSEPKPPEKRKKRKQNRK